MSKYIIKLPSVAKHHKQRSFIESPLKRKVIVAGRRGGKTTGAAILSSEAAMAGKRVLYAAPTSDQTEAYWEEVNRHFADPIQQGIIYKHETKRQLILPHDGRIRCKTAHDANSLRSGHTDLLILDEYQLMDPDTWDKVGVPMLLDSDGDAVFIGTAFGRNHFFRQYQKALKEKRKKNKRWGAWHFTSHDNPHLSKSALAEITQDMTEAAYQQEIMAEFLDDEGSVFKDIKGAMTAPKRSKPEDHINHQIIGGIDWGRKQDYTVASVGCLDCHMEVARARFNKIGYTFQSNKVNQLDEAWGGIYWLAEQNSIGDTAIELLRNLGLTVIPFMTTGKSKPGLIDGLAFAIETREWQFIDDPLWNGELESYEFTRTKSGNYTYSAPSGMHDDTVIGRALMVMAGKELQSNWLSVSGE